MVQKLVNEIEFETEPVFISIQSFIRRHIPGDYKIVFTGSAVLNYLGITDRPVHDIDVVLSGISIRDARAALAASGINWKHFAGKPSLAPYMVTRFYHNNLLVDLFCQHVVNPVCIKSETGEFNINKVDDTFSYKCAANTQKAHTDLKEITERLLSRKATIGSPKVEDNPDHPVPTKEEEKLSKSKYLLSLLEKVEKDEPIYRHELMSNLYTEPDSLPF